MNHFSLILFFTLFISTSKCAFFSNLYKTHANSKDILSKIVERVIDANIQRGEFEMNNSFLSEAVEANCILTGLSQMSQYNLFIEAFYRYIDIICLETLTKNTKLSLWKKNDILKRLSFVMHENFYLMKVNSTYKISDRTIMLMIRTIQHLESNYLILWPMIKRFGEYCVLEECQEFVYGAALKFREIPNTVIPYVFISRSLSNTTKYDAFLIQYRDFLNAKDHLRNEMTKELVSTIVYGPLSNTARDILLEIVNQAVLKKIVASDKNLRIKFPEFCVRIGITDQIIPLITDENDQIFVELKKFMLRLAKCHSTISRVMAFSFKNNSEGDIEFLELLEYPDLFSIYSGLDKQKLRDLVMKLIRDIFKIIELINAATEIQMKTYYLKIILVILRNIPLIELDEVIIIDFEPLLDVLLSQDIIDSGFVAVASHLGPTMSLYFTKLSKSHLEKFLTIVERMHGIYGLEFFQLQATLFLHIRFTDSNDGFWKTLDMMHKFYEERQMDISQTINVLIAVNGEKLDRFTIQKMIAFCEERRILSKTLRMVAEYFTVDSKEKRISQSKESLMMQYEF